MARLVIGSVFREGDGELLLQVFVVLPGDVDHHLGDGAAGKRLGRRVVRGHRRAAVASDGQAGPGQTECAGMDFDVSERADGVFVDEQHVPAVRATFV